MSKKKEVEWINDRLPNAKDFRRIDIYPERVLFLSKFDGTDDESVGHTHFSHIKEGEKWAIVPDVIVDKGFSHCQIATPEECREREEHKQRIFKNYGVDRFYEPKGHIGEVLTFYREGIGITGFVKDFTKSQVTVEVKGVLHALPREAQLDLKGILTAEELMKQEDAKNHRDPETRNDPKPCPYCGITANFLRALPRKYMCSAISDCPGKEVKPLELIDWNKHCHDVIEESLEKRPKLRKALEEEGIDPHGPAVKRRVPEDNHVCDAEYLKRAPGVTMGTVFHEKDLAARILGGVSIRPETIIIDDYMEVWTPGNEPEETGWYELTLTSGNHTIDYFEEHVVEGFLKVKKEIISYYKKIIISKPCQEAKRELLCPFCIHEMHMIENRSIEKYFCRCTNDICRTIMPLFSTEGGARSNLFAVYDKCNKIQKLECPIELPWITDREPEKGSGYYIYSKQNKEIRKTDETDHWFGFITDVRKHGWLPGDFFQVPNTVNTEKK